MVLNVKEFVLLIMIINRFLAPKFVILSVAKNLLYIETLLDATLREKLRFTLRSA
jgi:hypothetical protein